LRALTLLILLFLATGLQAQSPSLNAYRIQEGEVQLDGFLNEAIWSNAEKADRFLQSEPVEGAEPSEKTEISVAYNSTHLYIGATLHDSDPSGIIGYQKERDASLSTDDRFMIVLDTFQDGRTGYLFEVNPAGLMGDGLLGGRFNKSWDGIWEARVKKTARGWSAEIAIPFSTLNFDINNESWSINFQRTIRRKNEEIVWNGFRRNESFFNPIYAGSLNGLRGMSQGLGLEVRPYLVGSAKRLLAEDNDIGFDSSVGFDIGYNITPSIRAAFTYNTDFAEVEVDQRRVNLTRFPLFFPEKRDFFLEGSSVFSFAPRNNVTPFFSRNIGLRDGTPIPIAYGFRVGGQEGSNEIGLLHVRTRSTDEVVPENFSILRTRRSFFDQSAIGAVVTRRAREEILEDATLPDRYTLGADLDMSTRKLFGDKNFNFQAFLVWNSLSTRDELSSDWDRTARGLRFRYDNEPWTFQTSYREFGTHHDPAVGFVSRRAYKRLEPQIRYEPLLPKSELIRSLSFDFAFENLLALDNTRLTRGWESTILGVDFESGDEFRIDVGFWKELLDEEFDIFDDLIVPQGDYDFNALSLEIESAGKRTLSGDMWLSIGKFWEGTRREFALELSYKPMSGLSLSPEWEVNDVSIPAGDFRTHLFRFSSGWQLNPWQSATTLVQFDNVSELLTLFFRYRWTIQPGSDLFFVLSRNWQNQFADDVDPLDRFRLQVLETGSSFKVNYTYRL